MFTPLPDTYSANGVATPEEPVKEGEILHTSDMKREVLSGVSDYASIEGRAETRRRMRRWRERLCEGGEKDTKEKEKGEVVVKLKKEGKSVKGEKNVEWGEDLGDWRVKEETDWVRDDARGASTHQGTDAPESHDGAVGDDPFESDGMLEDEQSDVEMEARNVTTPANSCVLREEETVQMFTECALGRGGFAPGDALRPVGGRERNPAKDLNFRLGGAHGRECPSGKRRCGRKPVGHPAVRRSHGRPLGFRLIRTRSQEEDRERQMAKGGKYLGEVRCR